MDSHPQTFQPRLAFGQYVRGATLAIACILVTGCAGHRPNSANASVASAPGGYTVHFSATRLKDHLALASGSTAVTLGQTVRIDTASTVAADDTPALPRFVATLTAAKPSGTLQLVTRTSIRELVRTKKGKLKRAKRDQGALLPVRAGENQSASPAADPVQIVVRVERR